MSVGKRIRAAREAAGMTQAEVAKALGVSEASIRLYELGKRKPNPEVLERIAAAVGIEDPNYFSVCFRRRYKKTPSEFRSEAGHETGL